MQSKHSQAKKKTFSSEKNKNGKFDLFFKERMLVFSKTCS